VDVDDAVAAIQLAPERLELRVAQPRPLVARADPDAVDLEGVIGVFHFLERAIDIEHRQRREQAELALVVADDLHAPVIQLAGIRAPRLAGLDA
jgi:hypothetical protein